MRKFDIDVREFTQVLYGQSETLEMSCKVVSRAQERVDICGDSTLPSVSIDVPSWNEELLKLKDRNIVHRQITEINNDNIFYCKKLMEIADLRHLPNVKGNFGVTESEYCGSATMVQSDSPNQLIHCTVKSFVEQQQSFFDMLWDKAIPAATRIKEIEYGIKPEIIKTIQEPLEIKDLLIDKLKSAHNQIKIIIPTENEFSRWISSGFFTILHDICRQKKYDDENKTTNSFNPHHDFKHPAQPEFIKLLIPSISYSSQLAHIIEEYNELIVQCKEIETSIDSKSVIIIIDKSYSIAIEVKNDNATNLESAIGFATYSNSIPTVFSYISMFESFWKQSELVEKLKEADELQKDFIRIAVHELKNPIQPIVTLSQVLRSKFTDKEDLEALNIIDRNANKLVQLSNDVLDVTRIETRTLRLHKESFDIVETMQTFVDEYNQQLLNKNIKLTLRSFEFDRYFLNGYDTDEEVSRIQPGNEFRDLLKHTVYADKDRILQVVYNLLNNAVKFTNNGEIAICILKESHKNTSIIHVRDSGIGIDNQIIDKLFSKFVTKSERGTGLGLFICKNLIEAHEGRIWAKNNINQPGATFSFTIPYGA